MQLVASINIIVDTAGLDNIMASLPGKTTELLQRGALGVESTAIQLAPVDTGALRNSIGTEQQSPFMFWVMDGVNYGVYQELGTYKMRAQPFMTPAVESHRDEIIASFAGLFT